MRGVSTIADVENILTPANAQSGEFVRAEVTVKRRINFSKSLAGLLLYCPFTQKPSKKGDHEQRR